MWHRQETSKQGQEQIQKCATMYVILVQEQLRSDINSDIVCCRTLYRFICFDENSFISTSDEKTRVKLSGDDDNDYINASHVKVVCLSLLQSLDENWRFYFWLEGFISVFFLNSRVPVEGKIVHFRDGVEPVTFILKLLRASTD